MDTEERIEALQEISSDNGNYVKLSTGVKIGENLIYDIGKYFDLKIELKKNDKHMKNKLHIAERKKIDDMLTIVHKTKDVEELIKMLKTTLKTIKTIEKKDKDNLNLLLTFIISNGDNDKNADKLRTIILILNKSSSIKLLEPIEIIEYNADIIKLENIFKNKTYSSFDNIVLLDKFNTFKQKYKRLNDDLKQEDDELITVIIADIISKLKITYGVHDSNKSETSKITNEIYKKIGIDKQAIKEEERKKEIALKLKKEEEDEEKKTEKKLKQSRENIEFEDERQRKNREFYFNLERDNRAYYDDNVKFLLSDNYIIMIKNLVDPKNKQAVISLIRNNIQHYINYLNRDKVYDNIFHYYDNDKLFNEHLKKYIKNYHNNFDDKSEQEKDLYKYIIQFIFKSYMKIIDPNSIKSYDIKKTNIKKDAEKIYYEINVPPMAIPAYTPDDRVTQLYDETLIPKLIETPMAIPISNDNTPPPLLQLTSGGKTRGGFEDKSNNQNEKEEHILLGHYNNIKDIYIKLVISYFKLIGNFGGEENEIKLINNDDHDKHDELIESITKEKLADAELQASEKKDKSPEKSLKKNDDENDLMISYREIESTENKNIKKNNDRIKILNDELKNIIEYLIELYIACNNIKNIPLMTDYDENIHNILTINNIYLFKDKTDKNRHLNHYIIIDINKELTLLIKENENSSEEIIKIQKKIADAQLNSRYSSSTNNRQRYIYDNYYRGGYEKNTDLETRYIRFADFLRADNHGNDNSEKQDFKDLVYQLKEDTNYNYNDDNLINNESNSGNNSVKNNSNNSGIDNGNNNGIDNTIYENIWKQYMTGIRRSSKKNPLNNIEQGKILYDNVNVNNLVPEKVLGVNFQDKSIFVFLILIIRTIVMVLFELIIEYNLVKSLQYSIIIYSIIYLVLLILIIVLINYDSYKLRIVFNYLNVHINSSNLILHIILFIIFVSLIMIMIDSDDLIHNFGYLFDYTKIYVHIYENTVTKDKPIFYNILTRDEKIKLLYRLEIITMIIFIFSSFIILLL